MKTKNIFYLLLIALGLTACDLMGDVDKIKPNYKLDEETAIHNEKTAMQALRGIYTCWREWNLCAFRGNMGLLSGSLETNGVGITGSTDFMDNAVESENEMINKVYPLLYAVINTANGVIEALENKTGLNMTDERKNEIMAECKLHRGLAHFYLLRYFGQFYDLTSAYGIVLRDKPVKGLEISKRASVADSYKFILDDIEYAASYAAEIQSSHCYMSRTTAKAFQAKVLLSKGDYKNAALVAKEVIDRAANYGYGLDDYGNIFNNPFHSPEILFAPYTDATESCAFDLNRLKYGKITSQLADNLVPGNGDIQTGDGYDPRFAFTCATDQVTHLKFKNGKYPKDDQSDHNTYYFMRMSEVYYIYAEAEARQGNTHYAAARNSLQTVLDAHAPGLYDVNNIADRDLLEAIRIHKWIEVLYENNEEWFDLVRHHKAGDLQISTIRPNIKTDSQLILPIPKKALSGNNELVQNP